MLALAQQYQADLPWGGERRAWRDIDVRGAAAAAMARAASCRAFRTLAGFLSCTGTYPRWLLRSCGPLQAPLLNVRLAMFAPPGGRQVALL